MSNNTKEVHFVYLGKSLPTYVESSIDLALKHSGLAVHLLGNARIKPKISNTLFNFTAVEDFYDSKEFIEAAKRLWYDHSFRNGFWLKSLERFFVLEQYISSKKIEKIFHAELDQLLFRADLLVNKLDCSVHRGLYIPFHSTKAAVASVVYCNSLESLRSLLNYASNGPIFPNEMALISSWMLKNPDKAFALPALSTLVNKHLDSSLNKTEIINAIDLGGVVDAAQLGQWVAGIDPILVPMHKVPMNKYVDNEKFSDLLLSKEQLSQLKFELKKEDGQLVCKYSDIFSVNIYNLHIHSKIHKWISKNDSDFSNLFWCVNQNYPSAVPGTRWRQISQNTLHSFEFVARNPEKVIRITRRNINVYFKRRPSSYPFMSEDTFRSFADHIIENKGAAISINKIKSGQTIFCEYKNLQLLQTQVIDRVKVPVVLLLGNTNQGNSQNLENLTRSKYVHRIFAQKLDEPTLGIDYLPLGIENKWRGYSGMNVRFQKKVSMSGARVYRIMWDFIIDGALEETIEAANLLINCEVADRLIWKSNWQRRKLLSNYAFVACPIGNTHDDAGIWEAMYLGCVPIVQKSHVTKFYELLGLPIWVVTSFSEVCNFNGKELAEKYEGLRNRFSSEALWSDYWFRKIKLRAEEVS
jgi:hypothetical protein